MSNAIKVLFINNNGGGFADFVDIQANTTVEKFFAEHVDGHPRDYLIRVNRQPVPKDYVLQENDRITITPTKVEGAARVLFINNDGGGFADYVEVADVTTVQSFFDDRIDGEPEDYLIRVNRQPVPKDYVLQQNDRITITPVKVEGAAV